MKSKTKYFKKAASAAVRDTKIQRNLSTLYSGFHRARQEAAGETLDWEEMRLKARSIKEHTIQHLDHYLELAETNVIRAGGKVFFAKDSDAANDYILKLATDRGVKTVIKSKSMLSEEIGLNSQFESEEIEAVETDLGEYLIQLRNETPYHIIAPALHMSTDDVGMLLENKLGTPRYREPREMAMAARNLLRPKFIQADMSITGANFLVAETGTLVLVTNEGNGRMCTSLPRIQVAIMGMEKVIPSMEDLGILLKLLIRSATGQRLSSYITTVTGPRQFTDVDGPSEFHLVIVDAGRSKILADKQMREALYCLRCGACLNACPVYRHVGGHSYGWVYSGPIGAIISPMLTDMSDAKDLPHASSLCGACKEACPVDINIPRMLLYLRSELAEGKTYPDAKNVSFVEQLTIKLWRIVVTNPKLLTMVNRMTRLLQAPLRSGNVLRKLPPPFSAWTDHRTFPIISAEPFRERWQRYIRSGEDSHE